MTPIERPGTNGTGIRLNSAAAAPVARTPAASATSAPAQQAESSGVRPLAAGDTAPVETDRVEVIRKAVEEGRYPVVPTRIADAMIAAGYLLRTKQ